MKSTFYNKSLTYWSIVMLDYLTYWRNIFGSKKTKTSVGGFLYMGAELSKIRYLTLPEIRDAGYVVLKRL